MYISEKHKTMKYFRNWYEQQFYSVSDPPPSWLSARMREIHSASNFSLRRKSRYSLHPSPSLWGDLLLSPSLRALRQLAWLESLGQIRTQRRGWALSSLHAGVRLEKVHNPETWPSGRRERSGARGRCQCLKLSPGLSHAGSDKQSCCSRM